MALVPMRLFGGRKRRRFVPMGTGGFRPRRRLMVGRRRFRGRRAAAHGELKFHDLDIDDAALATAGAITQASCNIIVQGVTESTRIGRKVTIRSILWRYTIVNDAISNSGGTLAQDVVRVILYQDKQTNGAAATVLNILETANYQSFRNLTTTGRFNILMDRSVNLRNGSNAGNGTTNDYGEVDQQYKFYKRCAIPIEYTAATGAITEQTTNNLGVLIIAKTAATVSFDSKMRLRFSDN